MAKQKITKAQIEAQQAWQSPTLLNSWVNYGGTFNNAGYMKDSLGFVHLRGLIKNGTVTLAAFNLPAGYRPANDTAFVVNSNSAFGVVQVLGQSTNPGDVRILQGNNAFVYLEGITFMAEA